MTVLLRIVEMCMINGRRSKEPQIRSRLGYHSASGPEVQVSSCTANL